MSGMENTGRIMKATGGFYYVECAGELTECRARGLFRKREIKPLVGDFARFERSEGTGYLTEILPRRNELVRPPVANLDQLVLVSAAADPAPNLSVLDRLLAVAEHKKIEAVLIFTKSDLADASALTALYRGAGYEAVGVNSLSRMVDAVRPLLRDKLSVFSGNTGVGKSTLLNALDPALSLETGEISRKLGRGRHTTRVTQLYRVCGGLVADTPGFSAIDAQQFESIRKEELEDCFREFAPFLGECRFTGCSHTKEKGCAVLEALKDGQIAHSRWESYCALYEEAKEIKEWER